MLMLAFLGLIAFDGSAQKCACPKKATHHTTACKVAVVKKKRSSTLRTTTIKQNLAALTVLPVTSQCVVGANGEYNYFNAVSRAGYYPGISECAPPPGLMPRMGYLTVKSPAFEHNTSMPARYTCEGSQFSPALDVTEIPVGTKSLAVLMFDPKATPSYSQTYWMAWNIKNGTIPENMLTDYAASNPYSHNYGYTAVCPVNGEHAYHIRVYALDGLLSLNKTANRADMERAMSGHVLASGEIVGLYSRMNPK
jgi:Raf kinase inhibitor-like YbhB/YbcL family protein